MNIVELAVFAGDRCDLATTTWRLVDTTNDEVVGEFPVGQDVTFNVYQSNSEQRSYELLPYYTIEGETYNEAQMAQL